MTTLSTTSATQGKGKDKHPPRVHASDNKSATKSQIAQPSHVSVHRQTTEQDQGDRVLPLFCTISPAKTLIKINDNNNNKSDDDNKSDDNNKSDNNYKSDNVNNDNNSDEEYNLWLKDS
ncbi:hypothetical protein PMIN07_012441 [Paraphaeosphaeria minitans]